MHFGIHSNDTRDKNYEVALLLGKLLLDRGASVSFEEKFKETILSSLVGVRFGPFDDVDIIISIGGDGTFLSVIDKYRIIDKPFLGINKGSIGFLTEVTEDKLTDSVNRLINGQYEIDERIELKCELFDKNDNLRGEDYCLNDCSVLRGALPHIVKLGVYIDGEKVQRFYGDGLVVATPTGSTAYTLAAGGPLIMPNMNVMLVTPLCSHALQNTSLVIPPESEIKITLGDFESVPILVPDGRDFLKLQQGDYIKITVSRKKIKMIKLGFSGFFQDVRKKIIARGSFYENSQE